MSSVRPSHRTLMLSLSKHEIGGTSTMLVPKAQDLEKALPALPLSCFDKLSTRVTPCKACHPLFKGSSTLDRDPYALAPKRDGACLVTGRLRSISTMAESLEASYCAREVRRHDHDRYLTGLFAPAARRDALFALYAFNLEVAKTAELVSEAMLGRIRLQWWREALDEIYAGRVRRHEVVGPLAAAVARHGLTRGHFERLLDGREFDLEREAPATLDRLEDYAEATSASLILLALEILGAGGAQSREAGCHVGIAWALTGLLRAVPFHARQKRLYLPRDLTADAGLELGELFELRTSAALRGVVGRVAAGAAGHLGAARALRRQLPAAAAPALLPATLAGHYLERLERAGHDPFEPAVQAVVPGNVWRLAWARLWGRY